VPRDEALLSRIINCRVSEVPEGTRRRAKAVREALWKEMEAFVGWGWHLYKTKADEMGLIPCDRGELLEVAGDYEGQAIDFLHRHFVKAPGHSVLSSQVEELLSSRWVKLSPKEIGEWRDAWEREGVVLSRPEVDGKRVRLYKDLRLRTDAELILMDKMRNPEAKMVSEEF
jgi:hypothetical protein